MLDPALAAVLVKLGRDFRDLAVPDIVATAVEMLPEPPPPDLTALEQRIRAELLRLRQAPLVATPVVSSEPPTDDGWEAARDPVREEQIARLLELVAEAMESGEPLPPEVVDRILRDY